MALEDFQVTRLELDNRYVTRETNITDEWTDVLTFTVPENRIVLPLDGRIMYFKLTASEDVTGLSSGSDQTITLSNINIPKTDGQDATKMAKVWAYDSDDSSWHEVPVKSITEPNEITVDTTGLTTVEGAGHVLTQFKDGNARIYAQKPSGGSIRKVALHQFGIGKMHRRNVNKKDTAPTLSRTLPLIENSRLILSVKSSRDLELGKTDADDPTNGTDTLGSDPNEIATFSIGVAWGRMDQVNQDVREKFNNVFTGV